MTQFLFMSDRSPQIITNTSVVSVAALLLSSESRNVHHVISFETVVVKLSEGKTLRLDTDVVLSRILFLSLGILWKVQQLPSF